MSVRARLPATTDGRTDEAVPPAPAAQVQDRAALQALWQGAPAAVKLGQHVLVHVPEQPPQPLGHRGGAAGRRLEVVCVWGAGWLLSAPAVSIDIYRIGASSRIIVSSYHWVAHRSSPGPCRSNRTRHPAAAALARSPPLLGSMPCLVGCALRGAGGLGVGWPLGMAAGLDMVGLKLWRPLLSMITEGRPSRINNPRPARFFHIKRSISSLSIL